jgi:type I restriction enzyme M protein
MKIINDSSPANLPEIIKSLEELVLASSGVEPFEEILKLIYAKLYEEKIGNKIPRTTQYLFEAAQNEWPGMFDNKDTIELSPAALPICMSMLEKITLLKTDLAIIDTAFEYLLPKAAKGSRGQYFTPRHIIAEIIKILNPKKEEYILDPACGSGGFIIHAGRYIKNAEKIYGIDFDNRMVKIAKAMLLIAGFGHAKIYKANSLSSTHELEKQLFDVICTNPPFGGEIKDKEILHEFELGKDNRGKLRSAVERHVLFIEQIVRLLRPGGRAAIVVPQGILNNTNLAYIREWLFTKARIIGVIGLDANTFKPHTNVKTSVLFLQRWKGEELADYPIYMAVSKKSGKNLSGEYMYKMQNGKQVIDYDLPEITQKFREFIKKENLNF